MCWALSRLLHTIIRRLVPHDTPAAFWTRQFISIAALVVTVLLLASIWFDDPAKATTVLGLFTAGLAFALQRVVTSVAGYLLILRGGMFNVGDRIKMGGVRGDVIRIGFIQTTIMEMGQPPAEQSESPACGSRRVSTVGASSASRTRRFSTSRSTTTRAISRISGKRCTSPFHSRRIAPGPSRSCAMPRTATRSKTSEVAAEAMRELQRRYFMKGAGIEPRVYLRITDNWIELAVRFVTDLEGVREVKDRMSREIMSNLDAAGIEIASSTYEITGVPPLRVKIDRDAGLSR